MSSFSNSLDACISNMNTMVNNLHQTNNKIRKSPSASLFRSERVFELISEFDIDNARMKQLEQQSQYVGKLEVKLKSKLDRMEGELSQLQKQRDILALQNQKNDAINDEDEDNNTSPVVLTEATEDQLNEWRNLRAQKIELLNKLQNIS